MYDFDIRLPDALPGSFQVRRGSVAYYIKAFLNTPWVEGADLMVKIPFKVIRPYDLNRLSTHKLPCKQRIETSKYSLRSCLMGPVFLTISIPYSGFTAGATVPITVKRDNFSRTTAGAVFIRLIRAMKLTK